MYEKYKYNETITTTKLFAEFAFFAQKTLFFCQFLTDFFLAEKGGT